MSTYYKHYKRSTNTDRFIKYLKRTWKNKLYAVALLAMSYVPVILDNDATAFVWSLMLAVPMFFTRHKWFV